MNASASQMATAHRKRRLSDASAPVHKFSSETAGDDIRLQGVQFSIDDTSALIAKARAEAVKDASAQAKQLADAGGIKVGTIHTIDNSVLHRRAGRERVRNHLSANTHAGVRTPTPAGERSAVGRRRAMA